MTFKDAFTKHCENHRFAAKLLATIVEVPEVAGTFLELDTRADEDDLSNALADLRAVLAELGITSEQLTTERYTDAVLRRSL